MGHVVRFQSKESHGATQTIVPPLPRGKLSHLGAFAPAVALPGCSLAGALRPLLGEVFLRQLAKCVPAPQTLSWSLSEPLPFFHSTHTVCTVLLSV